ncbi:hypothetical protein DXG01_008150 [Tephrocybe rancida]|nr:hypothetical protein DXG01_008150 [Tephrocybe rancida]
MSFYAVAVVSNIKTTTLMASRVWKTHRRSVAYIGGRSRVFPHLHIFIESTALQLIVESVLLALFCSNINAQYIVLESVVPIVGITFNVITIRIKLHFMTETLYQPTLSHLV